MNESLKKSIQSSTVVSVVAIVAMAICCLAALGYNSKGDNNTAKIACTYYQNVSTADFDKVNFGRTGNECKSV